MLSPLRNRFGIPGVISVIALVFAMLGGAYAASNSGDGKATASAKAKKGPRGPKGPAGPPGPAGPAGPQGPAGAAGKDGAAGANGAAGKEGAKGKDGTNGTAGASGKSVTMTEIAAGGPECHEDGGAELEVEGSGPPVQICTGEEGPAGPKGDPWSVGGTLPSGATETGAWAFTGSRDTITVDVGGESKEITVGSTQARVPISFPIPLKEPLESTKVHFQFEENFGTFCKGSNSLPIAEPGELCVYSNGTSFANATFEALKRPGGPSGGVVGAGRAGAIMNLIITGSPAAGTGTWAVTGF